MLAGYSAHCSLSFGVEDPIVVMGCVDQRSAKIQLGLRKYFIPSSKADLISKAACHLMNPVKLPEALNHMLEY